MEFHMEFQELEFLWNSWEFQMAQEYHGCTVLSTVEVKFMCLGHYRL